MGVLNQADRISVSSKLIGIDDEVKQADQAIADSVLAVEDATVKDTPNKKLLEEKNTFINPYQNELEFFDGNTRTELDESILTDSVNRVLNNSMFPNDPTTPLPSIADGVWKNLIPFTGTHAIGKDNFETYPSSGGRTEQDILNDIDAEISILEAVTIPRRVTGKECVAGTEAYCENGTGANESACTTSGGTWHPDVDDYYQSDPIIVPSLISLNSLVQEWEDMMNSEKTIIPVAIETNAARISKNTDAIDDIDTAIAIIDVWQSVQDYDTTTALPLDCASFNALGEGSLEQAKLSPTTLSPLKAEVTARSAFIATRETQLKSAEYLGSITQDLESGNITSFEGLYGDRVLLIDLRVNTLAGTLNNKISIAKAGVYQESFKTSSKNAEAALSIALTATPAVAPGINTKYLNVKDASAFSAGDRVYVVADNQEELSGSIEEIANNRVKLTFNIPKKYTLANKTRLYKDL